MTTYVPLLVIARDYLFTSDRDSTFDVVQKRKGLTTCTALVVEEAKSHFIWILADAPREGNGFSARHPSREHGYYEQFRGYRSGTGHHYEQRKTKVNDW